MTHEEVRIAYASLVAEWDRAEGLIKEAERIRAQVVMASVNELRYAGRRLIDAKAMSECVDSPDFDPVAFRSNIQEAIYFCHRAQHDAIDAVVLYVQKILDRYEAEFGYSLLAEQYPPYFKIRASLQEANDLIAQSREKRTDRVNIYKRLASDHYAEMLKHYYTLRSNEVVLTKLYEGKLAQRALLEKSSKRSTLYQFFLVVAGGLLGLLANIAIEYYKDSKAKISVSSPLTLPKAAQTFPNSDQQSKITENPNATLSDTK